MVFYMYICAFSRGNTDMATLTYLLYFYHFILHTTKARHLLLQQRNLLLQCFTMFENNGIGPELRS